MGVKATWSISKNYALKIIEKKLSEGVTDEQLSDILEIVIDNVFMNFQIEDNIENSNNHVLTEEMGLPISNGIYSE